jgi:hypothetical protein
LTSLTDGGRALILVAVERARDFPQNLPPGSEQRAGLAAGQENVRQMRSTAPAQIPDAKISVCHGVGGMFAGSGTIIMSNERREP